MNCDDLTTFIKTVFDSRDLIENPGNDFEGAQKLMEEIDQSAIEFSPYHRGIKFRVELAKRLELSYVGEFYDGWALSKRKSDKKRVYVNKEGQFLKDRDGNIINFDNADRFSEGLAAARVNGKLRYLKPDGTFLQINDYEPMNSDLKYLRFSEGFVPIEPSRSTDQKLYLRQDGSEMLLGDHFDSIGHFTKEGYARISERNKGYELMSSPGFLLTTEDGLSSFESASSFSEGYAAVKTPSGWRFIDKEGKYYKDKNGIPVTITIPNLMSVGAPRDGWCWYGTNDSRYGFIDMDGNDLIFEDGIKTVGGAGSFKEGFALLYLTHENGDVYNRFIDTNGKYMRGEDGQILDFYAQDGFEDGLVEITLGERFKGDHCFINHFGQIVRFE